MTEAELLAFLVSRVARLIPDADGATLDVDAPLDELGLSSRDAVTLAGELEDALDRSIAPTIAWEEPSIRRLARRLTAGFAPGAEPVAVVTAAPADRDEPLAVVGVGCRFPGGVDGPDDFWTLLRGGHDAIGDVPARRWAASGVDVVEGTVSRRGGFLDDVEGFDAEFFGITPTEAELIDPQQRLLLEVAVDAIRHARIDPAALRGSDTGVFVGISSSEYGHLTAARIDDVGPWTATGAAPSIAAGRLSYCLDLQGPSVAVDTACSSSLVAMHQAVTALRAGECSLALVGGVNLLLTPLVTAAFERAGALAPDGRCKSFAADADGIGRGEGCGVVVLERLAEARAQGHRVLAVVHGSGVNSDGRSNGLTAPNPAAQEALLRRTYARLGIDPAAVDYVEAHGTGTLLGDPIEAAALGRVLGAGRPADRPLLLGSAKSNLGHLEAAAGIAGLIKVVLAMAHDQVPATLHAAVPNPRIAFERDRIALVGSATAWPRHSGAALAGVSGFGFGGTNAHVVLGEAPSDVAAVPAALPAPDTASEVALLAVAASTPDRATDAAHAVADWLETDAGRNVALCTIARSLAARPDGPAHVVVAARDHAGAAVALRTTEAQVMQAGTDRPVWVFSGYGQQWNGMGSALARDEPVFAAALDEVGIALAGHCDVDVVSIVRDGLATPRLDATMVTLFAVQIALAALWRSQGVEPAAVIGHSMGEVAAAVVAGGLTLADGAEVMAARSRLLAGVDDGGAGAMALLDLRDDEIAQLPQRWPGVEVAVYAGPAQVTVAGPAEQVRRLVAHVEGDGRDAWPLAVRGAGHSAAVEPVLPVLRQELSDVRGHRPDVRVYGTVLDDPRAVPDFDAAYWAANARRPVRFRHAVAAAVADGHDTFVEIAAHPVSSRAVRAVLETLGRPTVGVVASLRRDGDDALEFGRNLAALRAAGHPAETAHPDGPVVDLPHAPWRHRPYWFTRGAGAPTPTRFARADLGPATDLPAGLGRIWTAAAAASRTAAPDARFTLAALAGLATTAAVDVLGHDALDVTSATLDHPVATGAAVTLVSCTRTSPEHLDVEVFGGSPERVRIGHARVLDLTPAAVTAPAASAPIAVAVDHTPPGAALALTATPGHAPTAVLGQLRASLAEIMGHHPDDLAVDVPLTDLGFDSLMATRARTAVERDFGVPLPVRLLLQGLTLDGLGGYVTTQLGFAVGPLPDAPVVRVVPPRDPTERLLAGLWANAAGEAPGMTEPVADHAATVAVVQAAVVARVGTAPAVDDLLAAGTLEAMADLVRDTFESSGPDVVRALRPTGNRRPLFVFHPAGGPTSVYRPLVDLLPADLPVYGLERLDDLDTVEAKAARYLDLIRGLQPSGPYRLMGWSLGGVLAGECAQQLVAAGEQVEFLASIDTILPLDDVTVDAAALLVERYRRFAAYVSETYGATMVVPDDIGEHDELTQMGLLHGALTDAGVVLPTGVLRHQYTSYVDARIAERYTPRPWDGRMVLYRAQEVEGLTTGLDPRYLRHDETLGWDATVTDLVVVRVPGHHISMIDRPNVDVLARDLAARLAVLDPLTRFEVRPLLANDTAGAW